MKFTEFADLYSEYVKNKTLFCGFGNEEYRKPYNDARDALMEACKDHGLIFDESNL